jgi:hypothetical protein
VPRFFCTEKSKPPRSPLTHCITIPEMTRGTRFILNHWVRISIGVVFALFSGLMLFSNAYDWDFFLTHFEVERRGWIWDKTIPLWSYQICGGITRIGDPQSFAFSPVFLPVLLLGSFWGAKAIVLLTMAIGWIYLSKFLCLLGLSKVPQGKTVSEALSAFFLSGNFFLWHLYAGHLTFLFFPLCFPIFYYLTKSALGNKLTRTDSVLCVLCSWTFFSGPFLHVFAFLLMPLGASLLLFSALAVVHKFIARSSLRPVISLLRGLIPSVSLVLIGFVISAYKWLPAVLYQLEYPRSLTRKPDELYSLLHLLAANLLPTWHARFAGLYTIQPYAIWEHSVFSANSLLLLFVILILLSEKFRRKTHGKTFVMSSMEAMGFLTYFLVLLSFLIADRSSLSLWSFANKYIFHEALRAAGRCQIGTQLLVLVLLVRLISTHSLVQKFAVKLILPVGIAICALNFITLQDVYRSHLLKYMLSLPVNHENKFNLVTDVEFKVFEVSKMYENILAGKIVLNCYTGVERPLPLKAGNTKEAYSLLIPNESGELPSECVDRAYATQTELHFDAQACPPDTCFALGGVFRPEAFPDLYFNEKDSLYCMRGKH